MHVLLTADTVGGVWTYARELATGLARRGVQVTLVSFGEIPEPRQLRWIEGLRNFDFRPTAFRLEWMQDSAEDIEASSEYLLRVIGEVKPDLLHLNQYCYGALNVSLPKLVVAHSDVVSWWGQVHGTAPPESEWINWYRETVQRGLEGATTVLAPSRWMMEQVILHYGERKQSGVIYNGRSPQLFNPHVEKEEFVLSAGRLWDAGKQVSLLAVRDCGWPVVIAGATEHADAAYRGDCGELISAGKLELKGPQSSGQLRSLFSRAAVYAVTSRYEPFGLAPVEAALSRCAIVANDIPSLRELWGETAWYFKRNDADSLCAALAALLKDRVLRRKYGELAYQRARRRYAADRMVDEYMALYQSMVPVATVAV